MDSEKKILNDIKIYPDATFESKLIELLRQKNLFRIKKHYPWFVAAALLIGFTVGRFLPLAKPDPESNSPQFVLLLHGGNNMMGAEEEQLREYGEWAQLLESKNVLVTGEKLKDRGILIGNVTSDFNMSVGGYFIIRVDTEENAKKLALSCPHLKYGGWIELKMIDPL